MNLSISVMSVEAWFYRRGLVVKKQFFRYVYPNQIQITFGHRYSDVLYGGTHLHVHVQAYTTKFYVVNIHKSYNVGIYTNTIYT